jgi:hypothetical protein
MLHDIKAATAVLTSHSGQTGLWSDDDNDGAEKARAIGIDITLGTFCAPIGRQGEKSRNRPESTICSGAGGVVVARAIVPRSLSTSYGSIERRALELINGASAEQGRRPMCTAVKAMRPMKCRTMQ